MKIYIIVCSFLFSLSSFSQKISNTIKFPIGKNLEVTTEINSTTSMDMMGQSMQSTVTSHVTQGFNVRDINNSTFTIDHTIKKIEFKADAMGQTITFDSDKPEDLTSDVGKSFQKALNSKYTMMVDNKGTVSSVKVDTSSSKEAEDPMMGILMGQLNISTEAPKIGDATLFKILPSQGINSGYSWIDSSTSESGKRISKYTVRTISDKEVILDYAEESDLNTTQQVMGMEAKIKTSSKGEGQIFIDRPTGLLKEKTSIVDSKQTVEAQGQSLPSTSKMKIKITVSPLFP